MIHFTPYINPSMLYHPNQQQAALRSPFEYEQLLWRENWCPGKYLKMFMTTMSSGCVGNSHPDQSRSNSGGFYADILAGAKNFFGGRVGGLGETPRYSGPLLRVEVEVEDEDNQGFSNRQDPGVFLTITTTVGEEAGSLKRTCECSGPVLRVVVEVEYTQVEDTQGFHNSQNRDGVFLTVTTTVCGGNAHQSNSGNFLTNIFTGAKNFLGGEASTPERGCRCPLYHIEVVAENALDEQEEDDNDSHSMEDHEVLLPDYPEPPAAVEANNFGHEDFYACLEDMGPTKPSVYHNCNPTADDKAEKYITDDLPPTDKESQVVAGATMTPRDTIKVVCEDSAVQLSNDDSMRVTTNKNVMPAAQLAFPVLLGGSLFNGASEEGADIDSYERELFDQAQSGESVWTPV